MSKKTLKQLQEVEVHELNQCLADEISAMQAQQTLKDAMLYSVEAGGKRIRPLIILATCASFEREIDASVFAVAGSLEFIHTYSLIHDDLPEMDNDDLRRGKPTNHKVYGQALAVLAGDGLLTAAFEWLAQAGLPAEKNVALLAELAHAAGPQGMVDGQARDIEGEHQQLTLPQLQVLHAGKTGALIRYAFIAGAQLSAASSQQEEILSDFGAKYGLAFQIYDDILDVTSTEEEMGKAVHKDEAENKNTYPTLLGLTGAQDKLTEVLSQARADLTQLAATGIKCDLFEELLGYFKI
ncbi:farnesyl-diphosphate synthase [Ligilactobacillus pabuli]|uniref:Farnesyl-diphosphate synthase n=1 Tax=Ligilactobacillus pabuli TaxID=2886039 RepID=A0ABQ5JE57_9LACO|nr:farnesyl diphosphate synthase [Ligilactobacillus pabuli]GKS80359.1 farnesyl-diphosphate synthase [Ligilactobacillus pabuli]